MQVITYKDIVLKGGQKISKGTSVKISPIQDNDVLCHCRLVDGSLYRMRYTSVLEAPDLGELSEFYDYCESVAGERVEPDGHDQEGFPSWLLALGLI